MITYPICYSTKDISVFPDDRDCNLFYLIRTTPILRRDKDNEPIFRATFWSGEKTDDYDKVVAGLKGGYIRFDINLGISEEEEMKIKEDLIRAGVPKKRYNELKSEYEKRKKLFSNKPMNSELLQKKLAEYEKDKKDKKEQRPNYKAEEGQGFMSAIAEADYTTLDEPATRADKIAFGSILFTEGTVDLVQEKDGTLVNWHSGGGQPAMIGDNNSANYLSLTPTGAAVFYKMIKNRSYDTGIRFNLKFKMRLPALNIRIYAASEQTNFSWIDHIDKGCTGDINAREITQILTDQGYIKIDVTSGEGDLPEEIVAGVRESMMSLVTKKVEDVIQTRIAAMTPEERQSKSKQIVAEEFKSFVQMDYNEQVVIEKNVAPQATICDFFKGISDEQIKRMINMVDLAEEEFSFTRIAACASAPWDEVERVLVDAEYVSLPDNDKNRRWSGMFTSANPSIEDAKQIWTFRPPKNDNGKIKYKTTVLLKGSDKPIVLPEQTTTGTYLMVGVGHIGNIDIEINAHPNVPYLANELKPTGMLVDVKYQYDKPDGKKVTVNDQLVIDDPGLKGEYTKKIGALMDKPIRYKVTYIFKDLDPISMTEKSLTLDSNGTAKIYADFPFKDRRFFEIDVPGSLTKDDKIKKVSGHIQYGNITYKYEFDDQWETYAVDLYSPKGKMSKFTYDFDLKYADGRDQLIAEKQAVANDVVKVMLPIKPFTVGNIKKLGVGAAYYLAMVKVTSSTGRTFEMEINEENKDNDRVIFYDVCAENQKRTLDWSLTLIDFDGKETTVSGKTENALIILSLPKA